MYLRKSVASKWNKKFTSWIGMVASQQFMFVQKKNRCEELSLNVAVSSTTGTVLSWTDCCRGVPGCGRELALVKYACT